MRGIPVTSVARTVADLAATESADTTQDAFQEALYRRTVTIARLGEVVKREPRRKGAAVIRAMLSDPRMTRSRRERLLMKLIDQAQVPRPLTNVRLHGHLVDAYWPEQRPRSRIRRLAGTRPSARLRTQPKARSGDAREWPAHDARHGPSSRTRAGGACRPDRPGAAWLSRLVPAPQQDQKRANQGQRERAGTGAAHDRTARDQRSDVELGGRR